MDAAIPLPVIDAAVFEPEPEEEHGTSLRGANCSLPMISQIPRASVTSGLGSLQFYVDLERGACDLGIPNESPGDGFQAIAQFSMQQMLGSSPGGSEPEDPSEREQQTVYSALAVRPWVLYLPENLRSSIDVPEGQILTLYFENGTHQIEVAFRFNEDRITVGQLWHTELLLGE